MKMTRLAWLLLRGGGKRGLLGSALTFAAVAVTTALLTFAIAGNFAFGERGERSAWRTPVEAIGTATAIQATAMNFVDDQPVITVYLAATGEGTPPVPPGMSEFPRPGEVWVSGALQSLMNELPAEQLADRYGDPTGRLGDAATIHSHELLAVVGVDTGSPVLAADPAGGDPATKISEFGTAGVNQAYRFYQSMMLVATVLMVVPLLVFGGAAARLTVARRDQRLAALRLVGATPSQVVRLTVAEAMLTALAGAVVGTGLYALIIPLLTRIEIDGAGWYPADLWPAWWAVAATVAAIPALVGLSAVIGLRRVVISPLGVAKRHTPPALRAIRLVVLAVVVVAFLVMSQRFLLLGGLGSMIMLALLAGVFGAINLVGPWVIRLLGLTTAALSRRGSTLLAGRRLVDDPKSAWRTVAGIALTGFVAGFVGLLTPALAEENRSQVVLSTQVTDDRVDAVLAQAHQDMAVSDVSSDSLDGISVLHLTVDNDSAALDTFRTNLAEMSLGSTAISDRDWVRSDDRLIIDVRTGVLVVLAVSVIIAMISSAVSGASSILDRRQTYALLHLSGTPMKVLNAARRKETLIPLVVMGGGSIGAGLLLAAPFAGGEGFSGSMTALGITVVVGLLGILAAGSVSRPLLVSVMRDASPRPD